MQKKEFEINKNKFVELCESEQWDEIYMIQTVEEAIDLLIKKLQNISQKSLKSKSKVQKPRKK